MARWRAWMGSLGAALVDAGAPLNKGRIISSRGSPDQGADLLSGFSILAADSMDGALRLAEGCPHLDHGTIEVAEIMDMKMT